MPAAYMDRKMNQTRFISQCHLTWPSSVAASPFFGFGLKGLVKRLFAILFSINSDRNGLEPTRRVPALADGSTLCPPPVAGTKLDPSSVPVQPALPRLLLTNNDAANPSKSGAQARAVQTLRAFGKYQANAKRLDCARFTAAFRAPTDTAHWFQLVTE